MNKAIVTLSFDDGRKDNYENVKPLLEKYGLPATFNIATGYVEGKIKAAEKPAMSVKELTEMCHHPLFEIAGHGDMHINKDSDIRIGRDKLLKYSGLPCDTKIGFASPESKMTADYIEIHREELEKMGFSYVRTGLRIQSIPLIRTLARKVARVFHSSFLYKIAYKDTLQKTVSGFSVVSIPVLSDTTYHQLISMIQQAEKEKAWCVIMLHSVEKPDSIYYHDTWCWDYDRFEKLLSFLYDEKRQNRVEVVKTITGYEIMRRRGENNNV